MLETVITWAETAPAGLESFSIRIPDPSPGLVAVLRRTSEEIHRQTGGTPGTGDSHARRLKHVFGQTGLSNSRLARALNVPESSIYRWIKERNEGGTAPGYHHLVQIHALMKQLDISGNLLDDTCCQPMTVQALTGPQEESVTGRAVPQVDGATPVMVTFTRHAIRLLRDRSPDPP